jgi:formamidopyrimidine-DNA glycosylase
LAKNFTPALLRSRLLKRANLKIKQALTEQSLLAGVGNIYADETLFAAKIRPLRQVKKLQRQEWPKLYQALQKVLKKAIIEHGSSVGDFIQTNGQPGNFGNFHKVYDRKNQPCRVCKTLIKRVTLGGRSAHFCPHCQR